MRTVLYIAFAAVTLWLLWEVLMQYKARLRWRLLALAGFLLVAAGLFVMGSRLVIGLGAVLFAVGQVKVTLSYRSGFSDGWALGPHAEDDEELMPRPRRREEPSRQEYDDFEEEAPLPRRAPAEQEAPATAQFTPFGGAGAAPPSAPAGSGAYDAYSGGYDTGSYATTGQDTGSYATTAGYQGYDTGSYPTTGYDTGSYPAQGNPAYQDTGSYATGGYDTGGYTDQYSGTQYATPSYYEGYDTGSHPTADQGQQGGYGTQGAYTTGEYPAQQGGYGADGTWLPQQREGEGYETGQYPTQQPGYYEGQYRY
ncbi:hypothetical protein ACFQLX_00810 [Streptomyces polyrhachis]|uniref:Uncharacterized protein n=1 Tax=Streptomyces polyrhachis TaxID=1282885 RepID=A0ABW2G7K9_9ACTN